MGDIKGRFKKYYAPTAPRKVKYFFHPCLPSRLPCSHQWARPVVILFIDTKAWPKFFLVGSWCAGEIVSNSQEATSEFLQIDLKRSELVGLIATQGSNAMDKWVKKYLLKYSEDGSNWQYYNNKVKSTYAICYYIYIDDRRYQILTYLNWDLSQQPSNNKIWNCIKETHLKFSISQKRPIIFSYNRENLQFTI